MGDPYCSPRRPRSFAGATPIPLHSASCTRRRARRKAPATYGGAQHDTRPFRRQHPFDNLRHLRLGLRVAAASSDCLITAFASSDTRPYLSMRARIHSRGSMFSCAFASWCWFAAHVSTSGDLRSSSQRYGSATMVPGSCSSGSHAQPQSANDADGTDRRAARTATPAGVWRVTRTDCSASIPASAASRTPTSLLVVPRVYSELC